MFGFGGGNYLWAIIILILIVLQWFRVGSYGNGAGGPGVAGGPITEPGLMSNGGLFIIAIFVLIVCGCFARGGFGGFGGGYGRGGYGYY